MWSFESEQLESPDVVDPKPVPVPTPVAPVPTQDVGGKAPTVTPAKDTVNKPSTASTPLQDMGGTSLVDIESILINSVCSASRCCPAGGQILRLYPQRKSSAIKSLFLEELTNNMHVPIPDLRRQHLALHAHIYQPRYCRPMVARRVDLICSPSPEKHSAHYTTVLHARPHTMEHLFLLH